jgi:hypothetical protein
MYDFEMLKYEPYLRSLEVLKRIELGRAKTPEERQAIEEKYKKLKEDIMKNPSVSKISNLIDEVHEGIVKDVTEQIKQGTASTTTQNQTPVSQKTSSTDNGSSFWMWIAIGLGVVLLIFLFRRRR